MPGALSALAGVAPPEVAGAWLGAALWALHRPGRIRSVDHGAENTQSCLFYLLAILFFLRWREASAAPNAPTYPVSPAPGVTPPPALRDPGHSQQVLHRDAARGARPVLVVDGWRVALAQHDPARALPDGIRRGRRLDCLAAKVRQPRPRPEWTQSWPERAAIAGKDVWFTFGSWHGPSAHLHLSPLEHRRLAPIRYLPLVGSCARSSCSGWRETGACGPHSSLPLILSSRSSRSSIFQRLFLPLSFVGDHFQYLASIGPLALAGAAIAWACKFAGGEKASFTRWYPAR